MAGLVLLTKNRPKTRILFKIHLTVTSAIDDSTFTAPTESDTGATAVLDLPLAVDIIRESPTIADSIAIEDNDIGHLADFLTTEQAEVAVRRGPDKHPYQFPCDHSGCCSEEQLYWPFHCCFYLVDPVSNCLAHQRSSTHEHTPTCRT